MVPTKVNGLINRLGASALFLILSVTSGHVWAEASAVAFGSGDKWGWATRATQNEANKAALAFCNEVTPERDCILDQAKAIARADGPKSAGFGKSASSLARARKIALEECGNAKCKVTFETTKPGLYALSKSKPDANGNSDFYIAYQYSDRDNVERAAISGCEKLTGQTCYIELSGAIAGNYKVASSPAPKPQAPQLANDQNCRPTTRSISCSSQCTNGNCIVTYQNGCKIRVHVQPQFDGFTNQWTYPSPGC